MRIFFTLLAIALLSSPVLGQKSPCLSDPTDIKEVAQAFSHRTGSKFVLDPRVNAKVNTLGVDLNSIDLPILISIFNMHGFEVLESRGVLYVVPDPAAPGMRERLDKIAGL